MKSILLGGIGALFASIAAFVLRKPKTPTPTVQVLDALTNPPLPAFENKPVIVVKEK
jgi:hypothetical protein